MIKITLRGSFKNTEKFFDGSKNKLPGKFQSIMEKYGQRGVSALQNFTPKDTGATSKSWSYKVTRNGIIWSNSEVTSEGTPIAILLQYGHGTRNGGHVIGRDYINPALQPIFDEIAESCWEEVKNL